MHGSIVHKKLRFGPFELSIGERTLRRDGRVLPLGDRALDILTYLADRPGEVIAKQELMDHVWSEVTVEEGSLRVHVAAIRKALGDGQFGNRYIANIKGRGYSFVGTVVPPAGGTESRNAKLSPQSGLPMRPIMMIGRESVVSEVSEKLRNERFVTLLGAGGKTAEERYQTAAGVEADLRKCLTAWESFGRIDPFPLGLQDASDRLFPQACTTRRTSIKSIPAGFDVNELAMSVTDNLSVAAHGSGGAYSTLRKQRRGYSTLNSRLRAEQLTFP
jgi:DNA-binding winged helix-turn-helix (wHTH) protein